MSYVTVTFFSHGLGGEREKMKSRFVIPNRRNSILSNV